MKPNTQVVYVNHVSRVFHRAVPGVLIDKPEDVDVKLARAQWWDFVHTILGWCGVHVIPLYMNQSFGDGRYVEDALRLLRLPNGELLMIEMPFGHRERKPERVQAVSSISEALNHEDIALHHIINTPDDMLGDGGDTYYSPSLQTLFVGISSRTHSLFADFLEQELTQYQVKVCRVEVEGKNCLHLITGSSLLSDYQVAIHRPSFTALGVKALHQSGLEIFEIDAEEPNGANFFEANGRLIGDAKSSPRSCEIISARFELKSVPYDQSAVKNGSFTCDTVKVPV